MHTFFAARTALLCLALTSVAGLASGQSKLAIINLQKAVLDSDEIKKASDELAAKYRPRQQAAEKLQQDLASISQQIQNGQGKLSPQGEADLQAQGTRKQRELQRISEDLQADVERDRNAILSKSSQQMQVVVKKLAEEKGYDVVVDSQTTIYFKPALEITTEALAAYNKAYPAK